MRESYLIGLDDGREAAPHDPPRGGAFARAYADGYADGFAEWLARR